MRPIELAAGYMAHYYGDQDWDALARLCDDQLRFEGPLHEYDCARDYLDALAADPPQDCRYRMLRTFEDDDGACLWYEFIGHGLSITMAQYFEVRNGKISAIRLVFDTRI